MIWHPNTFFSKTERLQSSSKQEKIEENRVTTMEFTYIRNPLVKFSHHIPGLHFESIPNGCIGASLPPIQSVHLLMAKTIK